MTIRVTTWPQLLAERKAAAIEPVAEVDEAPAPVAKKKPAAKKVTKKVDTD